MKTSHSPGGFFTRFGHGGLEVIVEFLNCDV